MTAIQINSVEAFLDLTKTDPIVDREDFLQIRALSNDFKTEIEKNNTTRDDLILFLEEKLRSVNGIFYFDVCENSFTTENNDSLISVMQIFINEIMNGNVSLTTSTAKTKTYTCIDGSYIIFTYDYDTETQYIYKYDEDGVLKYSMKIPLYDDIYNLTITIYREDPVYSLLDSYYKSQNHKFTNPKTGIEWTITKSNDTYILTSTVESDILLNTLLSEFSYYYDTYGYYPSFSFSDSIGSFKISINGEPITISYYNEELPGYKVTLKSTWYGPYSQINTCTLESVYYKKDGNYYVNATLTKSEDSQIVSKKEVTYQITDEIQTGLGAFVYFFMTKNSW